MTNEKDAQVFDILRPVVAESGLYLEGVRVVGAGKHTTCRVTVDLPEGPGGVDSTQLTNVTRAISTALDEADPISSAYTLEVSTPGADRALTEPRHFSRAIGRKVGFTLNDGRNIVSRIESVSDSCLICDGEEIAYSDIDQARVILDMNPEGKK